MKSLFVLCAAIVVAGPAAAAPGPQVAESKQAHSTVSVAVEPQLNDGRLVIKVAAKNGTDAPVAFGLGSIVINKAAGEPIALSSIQQLINDVRIAAGMPTEGAPGDAPTEGAYASRPQPVAQDGAGRMDVTGYTGGSAIGPAEFVRRTKQVSPKSKPSIDRTTAEAQIAALKQAILQDSMIRPGQITVGQLVSQKLKFKKGEDRTLHLRVRIAGDEHSFTVAAPAG